MEVRAAEYEFQVYMSQPTFDIASEIEIAEEPTPYFELNEEERHIVESIVCGEAGNQSYEGKKAVANCILNAAVKDGISISEAKKKYGYLGWKEVSDYANECMKAYGNTDLADEVPMAVEAVFDNGELIDDTMLWFCTKNSNSSFHRSMRYITTIGNHDFYGEW